jgi:hypothetical protein
MTTYTLPAEIRVARHDAGSEGMPGSDATQAIVSLFVRRNGKYRACAAASTGSNQGYYQENYSHGPWSALADTAEDAVRRAVALAPAEWQPELRTAGAEVLAEADGATWRSALVDEIARLERILEGGENPAARRYTILGVRLEEASQEARDAVRRAAIAKMRRAVAKLDGPLARYSDEELRAELVARA